jgi:hypothetical protein
MSKHLGAEEHLHEEDFRSQNGNLHFDHFVAEIFAVDNLLDSD